MGPSGIADFLARFERLHPKNIDLTLERIQRLLRGLGNPHLRLGPTVHVAGTNGKASVVAFLRSILGAAGYRALAYPSPHLRHFQERIVLAMPDGPGSISEPLLRDVLGRAEIANAGEPITFFEITTAAVFLAFSETPADILVLETGLGGRLDATNVVERPLVTALNSIALDHCDLLGETLEAIAGEEAGILKPRRPVVVSRQVAEAMRVIGARAQTLGCAVLAGGRDWHVFEQHGCLMFRDTQGDLDLPLAGRLGRHQLENAGTAIAAARRLDGFRIDEAAIAHGIETAEWPARLQQLRPGRLHALAARGSEIWIDGAHNPAAGAVLADALADLGYRDGLPLHLVVGMLAAKDASGFFQPFRGLADLVAVIAIPGQARSFEAEKLSQLARLAGLDAQPATNLRSAIAMSRRRGRGPTRIVVTGSLYLAEHVLDTQAEE